MSNFLPFSIQVRSLYVVLFDAFSLGGPAGFTDAVISRLRMYQDRSSSSPPSPKNSRVGLDSPAFGEEGEGADLLVYQVREGKGGQKIVHASCHAHFAGDRRATVHVGRCV